MKFDASDYQIRECSAGGKSILYRAFERIPYCDRPELPEFQVLSIYVPECYYEGKNTGRYTLESAPVFFPNSVGGYMPGDLQLPGKVRRGDQEIDEPNSLMAALLHGYVAVSAGIRGRSQKNAAGENVGKAPALIVDYKAAVRYLHKFADVLPGDESRIITNGTSAGGALSSLIGATGNHPDYEPFLEAIGAADAGDEIYAASCYCPITNLDHADMAYEWEFDGIYQAHMRVMAGRDEAGRPSFVLTDDNMGAEKQKISRELAAQFPAYVNSLNLRDEEGDPLTMNADGSGSFREYVEKVVLASADRQISEHVAEKYTGSEPFDVSFGQPEEKKWLTVENGKAVRMDFAEWAGEITRMKNAPAFDSLEGNSPENDEFGSRTVNCRQFTEYGVRNSRGNGECADAVQIKTMNPMNYISDPKADMAQYWRIRHGERDRDTSLAISAILTLSLQMAGKQVDYQAPWERPHSGDYDLDELFAWIDGICGD